MVVVNIVAKDNSQPGNVTLVKWLEEHFDVLVKAGVRFQFKIIDESDTPKLLKQGINKLPAMIAEGKAYMGNIEIQQCLERYLAPTSDPEVDPDIEKMRNWQMNQMSKAAAEAEKEDDKHDTGDMVKRAEEMQRARERQHEADRKRHHEQKMKPAPLPDKRPDNVLPAARDELQRMAKSGDRDDQLIAGLFDQTS